MTETCEEVVALNRSLRGGRRAKPKPPAEPEPPRIPRITRLMALAIKFQDMVARGEVKDYADLARLGLVTRARMTQVMNMLLLAPDIQEEILNSTQMLSQDAVACERATRVVVRIVHWSEQSRLWERLEKQTRC